MLSGFINIEELRFLRVFCGHLEKKKRVQSIAWREKAFVSASLQESMKELCVCMKVWHIYMCACI